MTEKEIAAVKLAVRERDRVCVRCGRASAQERRRWGRGLHVHRMVPGSAYTVGGCELLCKRCHCLSHGWSEPKLHGPRRLHAILQKRAALEEKRKDSR